MAERRSVHRRAARGTRQARGQNGKASRVARGALAMEMERKVVEASRLVRKREDAVRKAQANLKRVVRRTGGAGLRLKDIIAHRPGGLSRKIVR